MSTTQNELDKTIDTLADVLRPLVQHIEQKPLTTKDHYSDYMSAIAVLSERLGKSTDAEFQRKTYLGIGVALQRAGASKSGVQSALRAMGAI